LSWYFRETLAVDEHNCHTDERNRLAQDIRDTGANLGTNNPDWLKTVEFEKRKGKSERRILKYVENFTREEFGYKKIWETSFFRFGGLRD
jgi:hypothetical protein